MRVEERSIFESLPGTEVAVGRIAEGFRALWADSPAKEARAVQLNLVLHLGRNATVDDAEQQFQHTLQFAHRYPCRVVVLCPDFEPGSPPELRAKIYGECFLGKSKSDTRCVEFVLLHYTMAVRQHLENQVSVCLSTDMPLYYWAHRFSAASRLADYHYLLTRSKRILFDSAVVPPDAFTYPWPNLAAVRDLAYTRTRALRQGLGQFLSRYDPAAIVGGLSRVTLHHQPALKAEADAMMGWVRKGLARCGCDKPSIAFSVAARNVGPSFALRFDYDSPARGFAWSADLDERLAEYSGDLGAGRTRLTTTAQLLEPHAALSEAMFA
jgi:hypothetical protein